MESSSAAIRDWLVVWTESRAEKKVAARIEAQGVESWLPTIKERHRWSDRWREVLLPLFPGYVFARGGETFLHRLLRTPGVLTIVKTGNRPAMLSDSFVASLRYAIERSGIPASPVQTHEYQLDDEIIVRDGPLAGLRGVVRQIRGTQHLVVWLAEVGRGVAFTLSASAVSPARARAGISDL